MLVQPMGPNAGGVSLITKLKIDKWVCSNWSNISTMPFVDGCYWSTGYEYFVELLTEKEYLQL